MSFEFSIIKRLPLTSCRHNLWNGALSIHRVVISGEAVIKIIIAREIITSARVAAALCGKFAKHLHNLFSRSGKGEIITNLSETFKAFHYFLRFKIFESSSLASSSSCEFFFFVLPSSSSSSSQTTPQFFIRSYCVLAYDTFTSFGWGFLK